MNTFLNLHQEHSLSWIYYKPERIMQGLADRTQAIKETLKASLHNRINNRGVSEQSYAYNQSISAKRMCKGTFHKGCTLFTKYQ